MAFTAAEDGLSNEIDRWAIIRQAIKAAGAGGTDFLARADANTDELYDLWCNVWESDECDTLVANGSMGDSLMFYKWYQPRTSYIVTPTTADREGLGYATWQAYLTAMKWRVPYEFGELFYERTLTRFLTTQVGAKGTFHATAPSGKGMHDFGQFAAVTSPDPGVFTPNEGDLDITKSVGSPIIWNPTAAGGDVVATVTLSKFANDDYAVSVDMTGTSTSEGVIGQVALTSGETAGATVLRATSLPAGRFVEDDYVLIYETDVLQEIAQVASMITDTSVTVATAIRHTYTNAAKVWPLYTGIVSVVGTAGTNLKEVDFYARPDRTHAL